MFTQATVAPVLLLLPLGARAQLFGVRGYFAPMRWHIVLALPIITPLLGSALAAGKRDLLPGIYSDMRRSKETDDIDGTELFVTGRYGRYSVYYQFWEGGSLPPVAVPVAVSGNRISFDVPAPSGECGHYEGVISARGFEGFCTIPNPSRGTTITRQEIRLPRKAKSFWQ